MLFRSVRDDNQLDYDNYPDIAGYSIGVYGPSNTSASLEKIANIVSIKVEMTPDDESAFRKLAGKRIDAVFSNKDVGWAMLKKMGIKNVRYGGKYKQLNYYIGFSRKYNNKEVIDRFNHTLAQLYSQGKIRKILDSYQVDSAKL